MKHALTALLLAISAASAQTNKPTFIRGNMEIKYNSRLTAGANDVYQLTLKISDSAIFRGWITNTAIQSGTFGVSRQASLNYQLDCDVVNPANPAQVKNVGRISGVVPISSSGQYNFGVGSLRTSVYQVGMAAAFDSKWGGVAQGKPLIRQDGWLDRMKKDALTLTRSVNGKTVAIPVKRYDKMTFAGHTLGAGPVQYYPVATVNGDMVYDYDRTIWFFKGVEIRYSPGGPEMLDKLGGNIRWAEKPKVGNHREGEYQFDVRVNEPPAKESAAFTAATDESAFFQVDDTIPSLTGTMKYSDTLNVESVVASTVAIDLTGSRLTKQQTMNLAKLLLLSVVVPLNAE